MVELIYRLPISFIWQDYALAAAIVLIAYLFRKPVTHAVAKIGKKVFKKEIVHDLIEGFKDPVIRLFLFLAVIFALERVITAEGFGIFALRLKKSAVIVTVAVSLYRMETIYEGLFHRVDSRANLGSSQIIQRMTVQVVRFLILSLAFVMVVSEFGFDVNGFIAGLGIAGAAIALATQRSLGNVVAGFSILLDKPYDIGDLVECNGIFGSVEAINFRSTRIRNFDKQLVVVPNTIMADNALYNYSRRDNRSVRFHLGLVYATPAEKLDRVAKRIKDMLLDRQDIDNERLNVSFERFNNSSLDLFIYYYTMTNDWNEHLDIQHQVNLQIMDILKEEKASVAFPSQSVYFENPIKEVPWDFRNNEPVALRKDAEETS